MALKLLLFCAVLCWGADITVDDKKRINNMIRKDGYIIGLAPDSLEVFVEKRTRAKLNMILYEEHPDGLFSSSVLISWRLVMTVFTERFRSSFIPAAVCNVYMKETLLLCSLLLFIVLPAVYDSSE